MTDCVEHSCLGTSINSNAHPFEWQNLPNLVRDINSISDKKGRKENFTKIKKKTRKV